MNLRMYGWTAAALLAAGCATAPGPAKGPAPLPVVVAKYDRLLADGRMSIAANVKNTSAAPESAQIVCGFRDAQGNPAPPDPAPLAVSLQPGEVLTVHFEAASPAATQGSLSVHP